MRSPRFLFGAGLFTLLACAASPPEPPKMAASPSAGAAPAAASSPQARAPFDPVALGASADSIVKLCDDHLAAARQHIEAIKTLRGAAPAALTYAATLGRYDDATFELDDARQFPYLMGVAHPAHDVREAAKLCEPKADALQTAIYLDADLANVIKAYAAKGEKLEGEKARLLSDTLRDFRRNGLDLAADKQTRLRALNVELTDLGQKIEANIGAATGKLSLKPEQLAGLPPDYIAKHTVKDGKVEITTDYPDYFPFATYAKDRKAALDLYVLFTNRGGDENVKLLERLFALRSEKAKLLGYATWADYAIEPRMAKTAKTVHDFLDRVAEAVKAPADAEYAQLMAEHVALGGKKTDKLAPVERYYLEDRVRAKKYHFDSKALTSYFEVGAVTKGLLDVTAKMYGLEYKTVPANAWHPDVTAYEVWSGGKVIGKFYLDLYSREGKYKHAAMFAVRTPKLMDDGSYQTPEAALECNFPKTTSPTSPGLMTHEDVTTFFHEFGHVLHHLLTTSELATYSGTNTVRDFVEAPSQMFEEWAWSREVLDIFAKHYETGAKIPEPLFAAMVKSRAFGRGLATERQLFLALLDQEYHSREPGYDTTKVVEDVQQKTDQFVFVPGTHFQSSFGHLVGYDAGYYSYQWALSLSRDVLTRFKKEGLLNPATATAWREDVLAKGGGTDEREVVAKFLGRAPNDEAYISFLKGQD